MQQTHSHSAYRPPTRWLRWIILVAVVLGVLIIWRSMDASPKEKGAKTAPTISVAPAKRSDVPLYLYGLGTVQAFNTVTARTRIDGHLLALPFREGRIVNAGDVLAQLDARTLEAQYQQALANKAKSEAQLANARMDLNRYKKLNDTISQQVLDTQQATVRQLEATVLSDEAAVQNAKTQLSYATITSPITGRAGIRQVDIGNIIHTGDANGIVTIAQIEPISVLFSLPQKHLDAINAQLNDNHKLTVEAIDSDSSTVIDSGVLEMIDNQIDASTGTILLKSTFPNREHRLWPGGFTNVRLLLSVNSDTLVIPTVAIQQGTQGSYVFVYRKDPEIASSNRKTIDNGTGQAIMKPVVVGIRADETSEIIRGIEAGDLVITDGIGKLQDKKRVKLASTVEAPSTPPAQTSASTPPSSTSPERRSGE